MVGVIAGAESSTNTNAANANALAAIIPQTTIAIMRVRPVHGRPSPGSQSRAGVAGGSGLAADAKDGVDTVEDSLILLSILRCA